MALTTVLPSLYEYYTSGGIISGLSTDQPYFTLNNKNITLYSGAMHYFRVPKKHWRDRLRKMRAAGLNTIETYVPWNLHEPELGKYDFGEGFSDMSDFLDIRQFLKIAQEEDLLVLVRPGPYICSEWEFGGMPSYLLRDKEMVVRTSQENFMKHVRRYFNILLPILALFQFTRGGPIIGFQIENEYGSTFQPGVFVPDKVYLENLRELMINNGIVELLYTSDGVVTAGSIGTLPQYFLQTANFGDSPESSFDALKKLQVNKPTMTMEYWCGWFDHWTDKHNKVSSSTFKNILERILRYPASFNLYMFHGGTNWGFMNGANIQNNYNYQPDTTSYDYDALLTEAGDYTEKYTILKALLNEYNKIPTRLPDAPALIPRTAYPNVGCPVVLTFHELLEQAPNVFQSKQLVPMELLPINNNSGQSFGYIVYRKKNVQVKAGDILKIPGRVYDTVMVLINGVLVSKPLTQVNDLNGFGYWRLVDSELILSNQDMGDVTLELIVENWGRNNFGSIKSFKQNKGLLENVYVGNVSLSNWEIIPLEFKTQWNLALKGWHQPNRQLLGPAMYKFEFYINKTTDTYIKMSKWTKGFVVVNGFVLGRHLFLGPQQTLYFPEPLQKIGKNEILVFEHFTPSLMIEFSAEPIYETLTSRNVPTVVIT